MTYDEALEKLRTEFHRTRFTQKVHVDPEIIAVLLGYKVQTYSGNQYEPDEDTRASHWELS